MEQSEAYQAGRVFGNFIVMAIILAGGLGFFILAVIKAFTRKSTGWVVTAVATGVLGGIGVIAVLASLVTVAVREANKKAETLVMVKSADGRHSLSVPGNWKSLPDLHDDACIKYGHKFREQYVIVIVENKEDLGLSLEDYAEMMVGDLKKNSGDNSPLEPESLTIGGLPALRHRVSGKVDNIMVTFHHTSVETPKSLCRVLCWSMKKNEKEAKPVFDKVAASFVEKLE